MTKNKIDIIKSYLMVHIHREDQAEQFFSKMYEDGILFHPEDDAHTIMNHDDTPLFTNDEAILINERMDEIWDVVEDPCNYVLRLISE